MASPKKSTTNIALLVLLRVSQLLSGVFLLVVLLWGAFVAYGYIQYIHYEKASVSVGDTKLTTYLAKSQEERVGGLSGKFFLPKSASMLFVFDKSDTHGIWMKDMNFAIDIAWLDQDGKVVYLVSRATPESYPHVFYPSSSALYVVELPDGFIESHSVKVGDSFSLKNVTF